MNERDLETRLRDAQRAAADQADPGALHERVLSIPDTVQPQRRRWWHGFGSGASRGAGLDGARVTRGPTMISAVRMAAVVVVLAIGTTFAISTVSDRAEVPAPGSETPTESEWVGVSGSGEFVLSLGARNVTGPQVMSDPRASGDMYATWRAEYENDGDVGDWTVWGAISVTNDEGSWVGEYIAFVESDGQRNIMGWMEGSGVYDGLTYVQHIHGPLEDPTITGLVYPGSIPPTVALGMDSPLGPAPALPAD